MPNSQPFPFRITAAILTCPQRSDYADSTQRAFRATDWPTQPTLFVNPSKADHPVARMIEGYASLIEQLLNGKGDFFLILEDDVRLAHHLWHNLRWWSPLLRICPRQYFAASLFDAGFVRRAECARCGAFSVNPRIILGSMAHLLSRSLAEIVLREWWSVEGAIDGRLFDIVGRHTRIIVHVPSLVQHIGYCSTWSGPFLEARYFEPTWRRRGGRGHVCGCRLWAS